MKKSSYILILTVFIILPAVNVHAAKLSWIVDDVVSHGWQDRTATIDVLDYKDLPTGVGPGTRPSGAYRHYLQKTTPLATVASNKLGRKAVGTFSRALPYVGLAVTGYMLYSDLKDIVLADEASRETSPLLAGALERTDIRNFPTDIMSYSAVSGTYQDPSSSGFILMTGGAVMVAHGTAVSATPQFAVSGGWINVRYANMNIANVSAGQTLTGQTPYYLAGTNTQLKWPYAGTGQPGPTPRTDAEIVPILDSNYDAVLDPSYMAELDAILHGLPSNDQEMSASDTNIIDSSYDSFITAEADAAQQELADRIAAEVAAAQARSTAAQTTATTARQRATALRVLSDADPTNANKLAEAIAAEAEASRAEAELLAAQLALAEAQARQAAQEAANAQNAANNLSQNNNVYDSTVEAPEKKNIRTLLDTIYDSTPIVSLIRSFSFEVDAGACSEYMFTAYETDYDFDLCPYANIFQTMGVVILAFAHLTAIFIIFRKQQGGGD